MAKHSRQSKTSPAQRQRGPAREETRQRYSPGELAKAAGVSADTLRFYERRGLLPAAPRTNGGHRVYSPKMLQRLQVVRSALSLGFTVEELQQAFATRDAGGAPCHTVYELATAKVRELEQTIRRLSSVRLTLRAAMRNWRRKLAATPHGGKAGLLESLAKDHPETLRWLSPRLPMGLHRRLSRS